MIFCYHCKTKEGLVLRSKYVSHRKKVTRYNMMCRDCNNMYAKKYYATPQGKTTIKRLTKEYSQRNRDKVALWAKKWRENNLELVRKYARGRWKLYKKDPKNRLKIKARKWVTNSVYYGSIVRGSCVLCGTPNADGHHPNYNEPKNIIWLCPPCHRLEHKKMRQLV